MYVHVHGGCRLPFRWSVLSVGRGGGRGAGTPTNRLFVGNLCYDTEQSSLQELFPDATDVFIPMNRDTGKGKG